MTECISQRAFQVEETEAGIDGISAPSLSDIVNNNLQIVYEVASQAQQLSSARSISEQTVVSIDSARLISEGDEFARNKIDRPQQSRSELIHNEERRCSTESTGSEKLGVVNGPRTTKIHGRGKELQSTQNESSEKYGSLALQSCGRSDGQSQQDSLIRRLDSVLEEKTIIARLDSIVEETTIIQKLDSFKGDKGQLILAQGKLSQVAEREADDAKENSQGASTFCSTEQREETSVLLLLSKRIVKEPILLFAQKFARERLFVLHNGKEFNSSTVANILTLKRKHNKGLLELLCLSVRQCLVIQLQVETNHLKITLVEGVNIVITQSLCQFFDFIRQLSSQLWLNNHVELDGEECIEACLSIERERLGALSKIITKSAIRTEVELHKAFQKVIAQRDSALEIIRNNEGRLGRYIDVTAYELDKILFRDSGIFEQYVALYTVAEVAYQQKRKVVIDKCSIRECFSYLEVDKTYQLCDQDLQSNKVEASTINHSPNSQTNPYQSAVDEFERLSSFEDPTSKLRCLTRAYQLIQECCLSYHCGEVQLDTMDNLLPVLIFVVLHARIRHAYANIKLIEHFVEACIDNTGVEARIITNVYMALEYISTSWQV